MLLWLFIFAGIGVNIACGDSDLLFHLKLDGNLNDSSGNGKNFIGDGISWVNDRFGNTDRALHLSGDHSLIQDQSGSYLSGDYSISLWFRTSITDTISLAGITN